MDAGGAGRLNRSSPSCLNRPAQRTAFFHGLLEGVEGLADAVRGLKTATNTVQQSDPGRIAATLKNIETQIEALAREVSAISEIKAEVAELKETITRTASVNEERTRAMINDAIDEVSGQSLMGRVLGQRRSPKPKQKS